MARYIYPNVPEDNADGRGSLPDRLARGDQLGCAWVELPADPVRDGTEADLTGLPAGELLDAGGVARLYRTSDPQVADGKYILNLGSALPPARPSGGGRPGSPLWSDKQWVNRCAEMLLTIAGRVGAAPAAVEIPSGDRSNTTADIIFAARVIHDRLEKNLGPEPRVWVENRAGQAIQTGRDMAAFWQVVRLTPRIPAWLGIVLNVDQLWTATEGAFEEELGVIPGEAVRALHVDRRRGVATLQDEIPWERVFARPFARAPRLPIHPRVDQQSEIEQLIKFCEEHLADQQAAGPTTP